MENSMEPLGNRLFENEICDKIAELTSSNKNGRALPLYTR